MANLYCYAVVPNPANESIINPNLSLFLDSAVYGYQVRVVMLPAACCKLLRHATPGCRCCLKGPGSATLVGPSFITSAACTYVNLAESTRAHSTQL